MISYAITHDPRACYGCTACVQICSHKAIRMMPDREGFMYPVVDQDKCVHCRLCSAVCPAENRPESLQVKTQYAVMNRDDAVLKRSSSGGVFRLLADHVLSLNGCVVGCVWDAENRPVLKIAEKREELLPMQGSKYISSNPNDVFTEVRRRLLDGKIVLFTGAPCQNAGLLNFLRKPFDNLITVDFLCHGMPSQSVFDAYVDYLEQKYRGKVENFQFRDKEMRGWGLAESFMIGSKKKSFIGHTSPFLYGFVHGYFNRYSCYECPFRGNRFTDFTVSDYWGVERHHPAFEINKGVSAVSVNSEKAAEIFSLLANSCLLESTQVEWIAEDNPAIMHNEPESVPSLRREIYSKIEKTGWKNVEAKYLTCRHRILKKIWYTIPKKSAKTIKRLLKRG